MRNALARALGVVCAVGLAACGGSSSGTPDGKPAGDSQLIDAPRTIDAPVDGPPGATTVSVASTSVAEGNAGTTNAVFTVTLSAALEGSASVDFATSDGTAIAGGDPDSGGADYTATSGTLTFGPGEASKTITVLVAGDLLNEDDETFKLDLSNPSGSVTIGTGEATGTISNDDAVPTLTVGSASLLEGTATTTTASVTVSLSAPSGRSVTVTAATADGTALAGADYTATTTALTFAPGETSKTVTVPITADALDENDETFTVGLSNPLHATAGAAGTVTILDDDASPTVSVADLSVLEGNTGTSTANVPVTLSTASGRTVTVAFATADDTATAGTDYVAGSGTITFAPGETAKTIPVTINGDTTPEGDEDLFVNLSTPTNATINDGQATLTILDDDASGPRISINDVTVAEGNTGTQQAVFTVTLSAAAAAAVSVNFSTVDGTATSSGVAASGGQDYTATSGKLTIAIGQTTGTISVPVRGDVLNEADETFSVVLANATNATILDSQGVGTITNDDTAPSLSINDVSTTEGNTGSVNATFTITLSAASGQTVSAAFATANGTALAGSDYTAEAGTATIAAGTTTTTVVVPVLGDTLDEANETYTVQLSAPVNATINDGVGTGTIVDNDATPSIAVANTSVIEGDAGTTTNAVFTLTLSAASGQTVNVAYATADGTATGSGSAADYQPASGTATFAPGTTTTTVPVVVIGDGSNEPNETFDLKLSAPANATISDATGVATIINDDSPLPNMTINDVAVTEGNTGTSTLSFTVKLSKASTLPITVDFATADGTATAGTDYVANSGTVTFTAGQTTRPIAITIDGDTLFEADETFFVNLTNASNALVTDPQGIGTINNNDAAPALAITDVTTLEGNTGTTTNATYTVTLSKVSGATATVDFTTVDGTALAGSDYTAVSGTLTFAPGTLTQTIVVPILGDTLDETNETYSVKLTNPVNATNPDGTGAGVITDDDTAPTLSIDSVSIPEGNAGTTPETFTVTLSAPSGQTVTVAFATANNTAVAPGDYTAKTGTLTFAPGVTTQTIAVSVKGDVTIEPDESYFVNLSSPTNASILGGQGGGTITNDD